MKKLKVKKKVGVIVLLTLIMLGLFGVTVYAASSTDIPNVNITVGNGGQSTPADYVSNIKLLILLTVLSLLPSIIIMVTAFTRIVVVFSFLKNAIGAAQSIPNQVLIGLALFLTFFIMAPVATEINDKAIQPYLNGKITQEEAYKTGSKPLKQFMLKQTRQKDLKLFVEAAKVDQKTLTKDTVPFRILIPAFAISELKTAFEIGFLIYLPFILIDLVVGSVLMSMGMMMLPPAMVSLPFKLLLFVMVDGWYLLVKSLILSFG